MASCGVDGGTRCCRAPSLSLRQTAAVMVHAMRQYFVGISRLGRCFLRPDMLMLFALSYCSHLQRNPDNQLYPLFEYFENWCQVRIF